MMRNNVSLSTIVYGIAYTQFVVILCQRCFSGTAYEQTPNIRGSITTQFTCECSGYNTNRNNYPYFWLSVGY